MITTGDYVMEKIREGNREYVIVENPSYVFPPIDYYPLATPLKRVKQLRAVLMDMDGTTTTTEELCIYSLETMVRRMSGKVLKSDWNGLDHVKDYPHIIGNSTTKHVEYLIETYSQMLQDVLIQAEFVKAAIWTLKNGQDQNRKQEVMQNLKKYGLSKLIEDFNQSQLNTVELYAEKISELDFTDRVSLGVDIYYEVYHEILSRLKRGESETIKNEVFGSSDEQKDLIAPMPGVEVILPMLKGWLGADISYLSDSILNSYLEKTGESLSSSEKERCNRQLVELSNYFERNPVQIGLVTSSVFYEADIIIQEVFHVIRKRIGRSKLPKSRKFMILENLKDYHKVYSTFVTASDSSEIRLKPHRDLYSIALHQVGISPQNFDQVIGFEDSESGTVAIRAAGIGCCIAVPFAQTSAHNLEAATRVVKGGIPEALVEYNMFLELN